MTIPVAKVLSAMLAEPGGEHYGLSLMKMSGLASGTLYPILQRLQDAAWIESSWEDIDPVAEGRPARRYYRLTAVGATQARQSLAELHAATSTKHAPAQGLPAW